MKRRIGLSPNPRCLRALLTAKGCLFLALALAACQQASSPSPSATPHASHAPAASATPRIPDYHADVEKAKPLAKTLDPSRFPEPYVRRAYQAARDIPEVLAQQPCYCYCDSGFGHGSLLECHIDDHSAG